MLASTPQNGDPQAIGTAALTLGSGAHTLTFRDWPAEIGIDNLRIGGCTNVFQGPREAASSVTQQCTPLQVPEPSTLPLAVLALGVAVWGVGRKRIRAADYA